LRCTASEKSKITVKIAVPDLIGTALSEAHNECKARNSATKARNCDDHVVQAREIQVSRSELSGIEGKAQLLALDQGPSADRATAWIERAIRLPINVLADPVEAGPRR
jgi:hypothetical protein